MPFKDIKRAFPDRDAKVLAIINQKGGVGKSTTAVNLAASLGEQGKKVLLLDLDPQGNTTSGYGIEKDDLTEDIYDALLQLVSAIARESILKTILSEIKNEFDYVFIDCPPSLGLLTINALVASDSLLIPIQCEFYALEGVTKLLESMKMVKSRLNPDLDVFGVVMTMYDRRTTLSNQVVEEVRKYFGNKVFKTIIPRNVKLSEAPSHGLPVSMYAHLSTGSLAYSKLAREVVRRG